jgi:hypothetical protein
MVPFASWSVLTADFLIILHLMLGGAVFSAVLQISGARWHYEYRRVALSLFMLYPLALVLLTIVLSAPELSFPWYSDREFASAWSTYSFALSGKTFAITLPHWHNYTFLVIREMGAFLLVMFLFSRYIKLMMLMGESTDHWRRFRRISFWAPAIYVLYGTMAAWDFEMTMLPEWHSAIYGMHHVISNFGMFIAFTMILVYAFDKNGILVKRTPDYLYNYISQILIAFTLLWIYTFFAQYLTIWYGNIPHERNRVAEMEAGDLSALWWTIIALKFAIPFMALIFDHVRHSPGMIAAIACSICIGTWMERYTWIAGAYPAGPYTPGYMPMTRVFDVAVTAAVMLVGWALVRGALIRHEVIMSAGKLAQE